MLQIFLEENMSFRVVTLTKTFATFAKPKKRKKKKKNGKLYEQIRKEWFSQTSNQNFHSKNSEIFGHMFTLV
jgi:hypothetical protein